LFGFVFGFWYIPKLKTIPKCEKMLKYFKNMKISNTQHFLGYFSGNFWVFGYGCGHFWIFEYGYGDFWVFGFGFW
jgi:hypothetical protein